MTITLTGNLDAGHKCHIYGGTAQPYKDLGLISTLPGPVSTTFTFDTPGTHYIHVYPGTEDVDNVCAQTGLGYAKVEVGAAPVRATNPPMAAFPPVQRVTSAPQTAPKIPK